MLMFDDRMEIRNPGGIYGRIRIDRLGKIQPDTRNPVLAAALEVYQKGNMRLSWIIFCNICNSETCYAAGEGRFDLFKHPGKAR